MNYSKYLFVIGLIWAHQAPANGANGDLVISNSAQEYEVGTHLSYLNDTTDVLKISDLREPALNLKFIDSESPVPNLGYAAGTYWIKFTVRNESNYERFVLDLAFPPIHHVSVYDLDSPTPTPLFETGKLYPMDTRPINHRTYAFPLKISEGGQKTYFLRLQTKGAVQIPLKLYTAERFQDFALKEYTAYGAYYGIILVMVLYNLFIYFAIRDRSYLYYVLYILNLGILQMSLSGVAFQWLWPNSVEWNKVSTVFLVGTTLSMLLMFTRSFLSTKTTAPRLNRILWISMIPTIGLSILALKAYGQFSIRLAGLMAAIVPLGIVALAIHCFRKGNRPARYFLAALGTFLGGTVLYALKDLGVAPANFFTENGIIIGSIAEITLLSLGLADRINILESDRTKKELEVLKAQRDNQSLRLENERASAASQMAIQVAHDIRSPLAALSHAVSGITDIPEESRVMIRSAANRITDIANNLILSNRASGKDRTPQTEMKRESILSLVEKLVTEKRTQFKNEIGVSIDLRIGPESYGLFSKVIPSELERVLSNVINNGVEALTDRLGHVAIELSSKADCVLIRVFDDGSGITPEVARQAFDEGFSFGKNSGSGVGLFHAKNVIESFGGRISIASVSNGGTEVSIEIPKISPPDWFVPQITLSPGMSIVILDDDPTIHQVWESKLRCFEDKEIKIDHFSNGQKLVQWYEDQQQLNKNNFLFLFDYELLNETASGLDLIDRFELGAQSILVTSRYEEPAVVERCLRVGARMIPKSMASLVRVEYVDRLRRPDAVLIDNDPMVQLTWKSSADAAHKSVDCFSSPELFLNEAKFYDYTTPVYVDSLLDDGKRGETYVPELTHIGFKKVFLATGLNLETFSNSPDLNVVGKEAPWSPRPHTP